MSGHPEHTLQVAILKWVRACLDAPHQFLAFDRSRKQSLTQHMREKARGLRAGTADTLLCISGMPPIWCELKAPTNKPTDDQLQFGADMSALGHHWFWVQSVGAYCQKLRDLNVPLRFTAPLLATDADLKLAAPAMRKSGPRSYKPRRVLAKPSSLKAVTRARVGGVLFIRELSG